MKHIKLLLFFLLFHQFTQGQSIKLLNLTGGETLTGCSTKKISWETKDFFTPSVRVEFSQDAGASWTFITDAANITGTNNYDWAVPNISSNTVRIRITQPYFNTSISDFSKSNFSITATGTKAISLLYPVGGEKIAAGTMQTLRWNTNGSSGNVSITYSIDGGLSWRFLTVNGKDADNIPNTGSCKWYLEENFVTSITCLIHVYITGDPCVTDYSDAFFTIDKHPALSIAYPSDGDTLYVGNTQLVSAYRANTPTYGLNIHYSIDNGNTWLFLDTINQNPYYWIIPDNITNAGKLKVSLISDPSIQDIINIQIAKPSIKLLSPTGAETFTNCSNTKITWFQKGILNSTKVDFSSDAGSTWVNLTEVTAGKDSNEFNWTVPNIATTTARIRVRNSDNSKVADSTQINCTVIGDALTNVTLSSPNGGESFPASSWKTVTWSSKGSIGNVSLQYSLNGGQKWEHLKGDKNNFSWNMPNTGTFKWLVPDNTTPLTKCMIRVYEENKSCNVDYSNAFFTINTQPSIAVYAPLTDETVYSTNLYSITWHAAHLQTGHVNIECSVNNGTTWVMLDSNNSSGLFGNDGIYYWRVPSTTTNQAVIRISQTENTTVFAEARFKITSPFISITHPTGGDTVKGCKADSITWTQGGTGSYVKIQYSIDEGNSWMLLVDASAAISGKNSYPWSPPNMAANKLRLRVLDYYTPAFADSSRSNIILSKDTTAFVSVSSPNGGESFSIGSMQLITWSKKNLSSYVTVQYSVDSGLTWSFARDIAGNYAFSYGNSFPWMVPTNLPLSNKCLVQIYQDGCLTDFSDGYFSLNDDPFISIYAPLATDTLFTGRTYPVKWRNHKTPNDSVRIDYSMNNGGSWTLLTSNYADTARSYNFTVPAQVTTQGIIRVTSISDPSIKGQVAFKTVQPSLQLTHPVDSVFSACQEVQIVWTGYGLSDIVGLDYSIDGGSSWKYIDGSYNRKIKDEYLWIVPNEASDKVRIRIRDVNNFSARDSSRTDLKIGSSDTTALTLLSPNGSELFSPNSLQTISWTTRGILPNVTVEYSINGGISWEPVLDSIGNIAFALPNKGSCNWRIPTNLPATTSCLVRIYGHNKRCIMDMSNGFFSLDKRPNITITKPVENKILYLHQSALLKWLSYGLPHHAVDIDYSLNNGTTWILLDSNYLSDAHWWTVPNQTTNQGIIRIRATGDHTISSEVHFKIAAPSISLVSPAGGESYSSCKKEIITWVNTGAAGYVNLDYSFDGGTQWQRFDSVAQAEDTNKYEWVVPNVASKTVRIRIRDGYYLPAKDSSKANFSITSDSSRTLTLITPNGGEMISPGEHFIINWVKYGVTDYVHVIYSIDGGAHWEFALDKNGIPAYDIKNTGLFQWIVPTLKGTFPKCLVKVINSDKPCVLDYSDQFFRIDTVPYLKIENPKDNDTLYANRKYFINWIGKNIPGNVVVIDYSIDNGTSWILLDGNHINQAYNQFDWMIPNTLTKQGILRVSVKNNPALKSQVRFEIAPSSITLISPAGGEIVANCSTVPIHWNQEGAGKLTKLDCSYDSGSNWILITHVPSKKGANQYDWAVPNIASDKIRIRVSDSDNSLIADSSKKNMTILSDPTARITILSPNGGESFSSCTFQLITWNATNNIGNVSIQFSKDGLYWEFARDYKQKNADNMLNTGSFNWLLPSGMDESHNYLLRIYETNKNCHVDYSDAMFSIKNVPTVTITIPQPEVTWYVGKTYAITWVGDQVPGNSVDVAYSYDNGSSWKKIVSTIVLSFGSYPWNTPNTISDQCLMRVRSSADSAIQSIVPFNIALHNTSITLNAPMGGEVLTGCSNSKITWTYSDTVDWVDLDYSLDGGDNWINISELPGSSAEFSWSVPNMETSEAKIRVRDHHNKLNSDSSKTTFSIVTDTSGYLLLISPNGGESFPAGSLQLIEWKTKGNIPKISIQYSIDGGITWAYIADGINVYAENIDNTGATYWRVPPTLPLASKCMLRIFKPWAIACLIDYSDLFFSINHDPAIAITKPSPDEVRYVGTSYPIQWEKTNLTSDAVTIDYSTDNGTTWSMIDSSKASVYNWMIPNTISSKSVIRVRSKLNNTIKSLVNFKISPPVSVQENMEEGKNWKIYPNPASDELHVMCTLTEGTSLTVRLINVQGQLIFTETHANYKGIYKQVVNLHNELPGIYLLQIITGKEMVSKKIIKN